MRKRSWKIFLILMTIAVVLAVGLKFNGSFPQLLKQREDFIRNVQMGGDRYTFSFASLKYYFSCITEPFAFLNIFGNIGSFAVLTVLACGAFSDQSIWYGVLYGCLIGIGIEVFQYMTWFGAFDISDIFLRCAGSLVGYLLYVVSAKVWGVKKTKTVYE